MKDIYTRVPVDKLAAAVTSKGEHYDPELKYGGIESDTPIATKPIAKANIANPGFTDLTGCRFGRYVVIGVARDVAKAWVVRCECGRYAIRSSKAIKNPANSQDCCRQCRHLMQLQRTDYWLRTGRDKE